MTNNIGSTPPSRQEGPLKKSENTPSTSSWDGRTVDPSAAEGSTKPSQIFDAQLKENLPENAPQPTDEEMRNAAKIQKPPDPSRPKSPITAKALQLQGKLIRVVGKVLRWSTQQQELKPMGISGNLVTQMIADDEHEAFYKKGAEDDMATPTMEKMMWDIAVIMGIEYLFVPTMKTVVMTAPPSAPSQGSIQPKQEGIILEKMLTGNSKITVNRTSLISATLTSVVLGMSDAHTDNIFVDPEGNIKFFDNSRTMPNTNQFLDRGDYLSSPFRSALLGIEGSEQELTPTEIEQLKSELTAYEGKLADLEKFLNRSQTQAQIARLPPGWMNTPEALAAMKERIVALRNLLNTTSKLSLTDLALNCYPHLKFTAALTFISVRKRESYQDPKELMGETLMSVGYSSLNELLDTCVDAGVNPAMIQSLCSDPNLNFDQILTTISQAMAEKTKRMRLLRAFGNARFNPEFIQSLIENPSHTLDEIIGIIGKNSETTGKKTQPIDSNQLSKALKLLKAFDLTSYREGIAVNRVEAARLLTAFRREAKVDYKDFGKKRVQEATYESMLTNLENESIKISDERVHQTVDTMLQNLPLGSYKLYLTQTAQEKSPTLNLITKTLGGAPKHCTVDYRSVPGKFILKNAEGNDLPPMTAGELKAVLDSPGPQSPVYNQEMPAYETMVADLRNASIHLSVQLVDQDVDTMLLNLPLGVYKFYLTQTNPGQPPTLNLITKSQAGVPQHFTLNYLSIPGKFIATNGPPPLTAVELKNILDTQGAEYTQVVELKLYNVDEAQANQMLSDNQWLTRPDSRIPNGLIVQYKSQGIPYSLPLVKDLSENVYVDVTGEKYTESQLQAYLLSLGLSRYKY